MKVCCLVPREHFHAPVVLDALARRKGCDVLAVLTPKIPRGGLRRVIAESGWRYLIAMAGMKAAFRLHAVLEAGNPAAERRYLGVREVVRAHGLRSVEVADVNGPEAEAAIRAFGPDLILSIFFNQIVRDRIRRLAPEALNVHPSPLPRYRGVSPCFWILKEGEGRAGASIHRLTDEVDAGDVLLRREFPVETGLSVFELYRRAAGAAAGMVEENLDRLAAGAVPPIDAGGEEPSRYGKITPEAVREFRRAGGRFCRMLRPLRGG